MSNIGIIYIRGTEKIAEYMSAQLNYIYEYNIVLV